LYVEVMYLVHVLYHDGARPCTEDNRVKFPEWAEMKPTTPFGQLPVLKVDGQEYAQSAAMLQFAGKLTGMVPKDPVKALKVDEAVGLDDDLRGKIRPSICRA